MAWTTMRDVEAAVIDAMGGPAAVQRAGLEVDAVREAAREAWGEVGVGRYEEADSEVRLAVVDAAIKALA